MATTCSFGQIKDGGRFRSICINGKEIINSDRDLKCIRCFKSKSGCFRKYLKTNKVTEKSDGLVVNRPIFFNPHGYGRIYLNCFLDFEEVADDILDPDCWTISYETKGPKTLLLPTMEEEPQHHFTVPSEYKNSCLTDWCALVEVCVQLKILLDDVAGTVQFCIKKNDNTEVSTICVPTEGDTFDEFEEKTVSICDIIKCNPSDTLDIYVKFEFAKVTVIRGSENSYATFNIIGLVPPEEEV